ncbi:MAG TPA: alpha-hydroxy acid oxidase [Mycobacteriales bacterium]|nr:alpha-hydroxy acid oxidase [Mycobacteriales bacterium]
MSAALPVTPAGWEAAARAALSPEAWAYYAGGAADEVTLEDNVAAWRRWALRSRVLVDVTEVDTATTLLGVPRPHPLLVAPTAFHRGLHAGAEPETLRGSARADAIFCLSTSATTTPAELAAAEPGAPRWFQLYLRGGLDGGVRMLAPLADLGYEAVVVTVDLPVLGVRDRERALPWDPEPAPSTIAASGEAPYVLDARGLETLVAASPVPLLVKGVLDARDARTAVETGAAGVVVSNHGGRQLDTVLATADVLPEVAAEVGRDVDVLVDGGVRRGTDVVAAMALGARGVLIGRPCLWGLAVGGADGVQAVLTQLLDEVRVALALLGVGHATDLSAAHVTRAPWR